MGGWYNKVHRQDLQYHWLTKYMNKIQNVDGYISHNHPLLCRDGCVKHSHLCRGSCSCTLSASNIIIPCMLESSFIHPPPDLFDF